MQLKIKRSQREAGLVSSKVIFCFDARVEFAGLERQSIERYKLHIEVIYNSEASKRHLATSDARQDGSTRGALKSLASLALAAMNLNITIASLERGHHIECKSMEELLDAEDELIGACKNLKAYLDAAATFDGRELLIDFSGTEPTVVAQAVTPEPMTVVPTPAASALPPPSLAIAAPRIAEPSEPTEYGTYDFRQPQQFLGVDLPPWADEKVVKQVLMGAGFLFVLLLIRSCIF